mgnify:CR=1 FL=1
MTRKTKIVATVGLAPAEATTRWLRHSLAVAASTRTSLVESKDEETDE